MKKHIMLSVVLVMTTTLSASQQQKQARNVRSEDQSPKAASIPTIIQNLQPITYRIVTSMKAVDKRLILWIVMHPEDFTRDRMVLLAHQLNSDFSNESLIYAVFFDSEDTARHYNPAGGSYYIAKELERGEYKLDRVRGRESINFSSQRGNSVDEIIIVLNHRDTTGKKRKRMK